MIKEYRKKPVIIQACQFTEDTIDSVRSFLGLNSITYDGVTAAYYENDNACLRFIKDGTLSLKIKTMEGEMNAKIGDYIIKGVNGEFYPCDEGIFHKTYTDEDPENISDGYHTFKELYRYRKLYNAAFFNELARHTDIQIVKSWKHNDGEPCFGGGWFIVMAELPTGQVSNHYEEKDWDLFKVPEAEVGLLWDGHTPEEAADRIEKFIRFEVHDCMPG